MSIFPVVLMDVKLTFVSHRNQEILKYTNYLDIYTIL